MPTYRREPPFCGWRRDSREKLHSITNAVVANAKSQSALQLGLASFRANVPQYTLEVDRVKTQTLQVSLDQVFAALAGYLGSSYVDQFNKFGRVFQIYVQAQAQDRLRPQDINNLTVRNKDGDMIPLGTLVKITPAVGPSLPDQPFQSLSVGDHHRASGAGLLVGRGA
jgi:HAE1 family hydrophobic/amphiphilic exporter-1